RSVLDTPFLNIHSLEAASSFLKTYGFNSDDTDEANKLWQCHRRSLVLMTEKLKFKLEEIPLLLTDRKHLEDLRWLLLLASSKDNQNLSAPLQIFLTEKKALVLGHSIGDLQKWSCAFLRSMHVFIHAESDLFSFFSEEIQKQILSGFQEIIYHDGTQDRIFLKNFQWAEDLIPLVKFEVKPFKTSSSTVIKLLAKRNALAMNVFDKVGVRFITKNIYDSFRVLQTLVDQNVISFPHIMPDQSSNNIYPVDLFVKIYEEHKGQRIALNDFEHHLQTQLANLENAQFIRKENHFSSGDYKFIKFITRKLIRIKPDQAQQVFSFFYPFEVQILDEAACQSILSGPSEHEAYKERQRRAARSRLFSESPTE
ncbi:MAG: TIGR04552 family protein, partial [Pseudobdellovibrionaceae bacterium]